MQGIPTPYWDHIIPAAYRILGNVDRVAGSPTEGSASRDAWLYRFGGTFHPATRQCAFYSLARLYSEESADNPFRRNGSILRSVRQILSFTLSLQNRDGSFPEWYRGQPSYCATAFLAAYLSETLLMVPGELDAPLKQRIMAALDSAAGFLARPRRSLPANQASAALLALHNVGSLSGTDRAKTAARMRDAFIASRPAGGWFVEDSGPDLGYQSLALDFLTRCIDRGMEGLDETVAAALSFLDRFVLPDGSSPPCLSSRGTGFLVPFAIERWAPSSEPARRLATRVRSAVGAGLLPTPATVDDRYAAHIVLPSFVDACFCGRHAAAGGNVPDTAAPSGECGGLRIIGGGALRIWIQRERGAVVVFSDTLGRTAWENPSYCLYAGRKAHVPAASDTGCFDGETRYAWDSVFRRVRGGEASTRLGAAVASRASLVAGRIHRDLPRLLESRIRRAAFACGAEAPVRIRREVDTAGASVRVRDVIEGPGMSGSSRLIAGGATPPLNQPSAGFFSARELRTDAGLDAELRRAVAADWARSGRVEVEWAVASGAHGIDIDCRVNGTRIHGGGSDARVLR